MDEESKFENALEVILEGGSPFPADAYRFVRDSLLATLREIRRKESGPDRHLSGPELLEGFRRCAIKDFGPMSKSVLDTWNISETGDVGKRVFNTIEPGTNKTIPDPFESGIHNLEDVYVLLDKATDSIVNIAKTN